jgi:hypothetical protein
LDVDKQHKYDTAYFSAISTEWKNGGREALMDFLGKRNIGSFNHRLRPETIALTDQKIRSLHGARRIIYEMLATGDPPVAKIEDDRVFVSTRDLWNDSQRKCSETSLAAALSVIASNQIAVREQCPDAQTQGFTRRKGFWLPRLREARARWCDSMKLNGVKWPRDDDEWTPSEDDPPF